MKDEKNLLMLYSEWLDSEGLVADTTITDDDRTHDELTDAFLESLYAYGENP